MYKSLNIETRPPIQPCSVQIKFADGRIQKSYGKINLPVHIGKSQHIIEFLVGEFSDEAILGITDLQRLGLTIQFADMKVSKGNICIPVHDLHCNNLSNKLYLRKSVTI